MNSNNNVITTMISVFRASFISSYKVLYEIQQHEIHISSNSVNKTNQNKTKQNKTEHSLEVC